MAHTDQQGGLKLSDNVLHCYVAIVLFFKEKKLNLEYFKNFFDHARHGGGRRGRLINTVSEHELSIKFI